MVTNVWEASGKWLIDEESIWDCIICGKSVNSLKIPISNENGDFKNKQKWIKVYKTTPILAVSPEGALMKFLLKF